MHDHVNATSHCCTTLAPLQLILKLHADVEPFMIAAAIEEAVHVQKSEAEYKTRMRTIIFNLKDKKNPELRRRLVLGEISPEDFAVMSSEEMASDTKQDEIKKIRCGTRLI